MYGVRYRAVRIGLMADVAGLFPVSAKRCLSVIAVLVLLAHPLGAITFVFGGISETALAI